MAEGVPPIKAPVEELITAVQSQTRNMDEEVKNNIINCSYNIIDDLKNNYKPSVVTYKTHKLIKDIKSKDVYITKADKSNNVVILDKITYDERVQKLIDEGPYEIVENDPLKKLTNDVKNKLNKHMNVLIELICPISQIEQRPHNKYTTSKLAQSVRFQLKNRNPHIPRLHCTTKLHKIPPDKMRPISSNIDAPCEMIAKWLVQQFSKLKPPKSLAVKNGNDFIKQMNGVKIFENEIMVSYDVESLYPNVPVDEAIVILRNWLETNGVLSQYVEMYVELTKLCMDQNYFMFRNKFYKQKFGTAMGNSLSSFISELFMAFFEMNISDDPRFPRVWFRFADDVFSIMNRQNVEPTLTWLNTVKPTIKFTKEEEENGKIPFLDVMVINNMPDIEFDVYRKPTYTNRLITSDSFHNFKHKMAAFHSMAHRMVSMPLNDVRYETENRRIMDIGKINGYSSTTINNIINKHEIKKRLRDASTLLDTTKEEIERVVLPYAHTTTNSLSKVYRRNDMQAVNQNIYPMQKLLGTAKDKIPKLQKSGVYSIDCQQNCDFKYYGVSERNATVRYLEHEKCYFKKDKRSAVARHLIDNKHVTDLSNVKLVQPVSGRNTTVFECYEKIQIIKNGRTKNLMNLNNGNIDSPLFNLI